MGRLRPWRAQSGGILEGRGGGSVLYINPNKHKIICNSVKTSVIREKMDIKIDILELSKTFNNILEDSRPF